MRECDFRDHLAYFALRGDWKSWHELRVPFTDFLLDHGREAEATITRAYWTFVGGIGRCVRPGRLYKPKHSTVYRRQHPASCKAQSFHLRLKVDNSGLRMTGSVIDATVLHFPRRSLLISDWSPFLSEDVVTILYRHTSEWNDAPGYHFPTISLEELANAVSIKA